MLKEDRLKKILDILHDQGSAENSSLKEMLGVSDMTIRRDLDELVQMGAVRRTHGGAVLNYNDHPVDPSYSLRAAENDDEKNFLSAAAIQFLNGCKFIFLDSGTTTEHFAKLIPMHAPIVCITNGINIAGDLLARDDIPVIMIGGEMTSNTLASLGSMAEQQLSGLMVEAAFMGCNAITPEGDVMIGNSMRVGIKRQAMKIADKKYLLADSTKFSKRSLIPFAHINDFNAVITDRGLSDEIYESFSRFSTTIIRA